MMNEMMNENNIERKIIKPKLPYDLGAEVWKDIKTAFLFNFLFVLLFGLVIYFLST